MATLVSLAPVVNVQAGHKELDPNRCPECSDICVTSPKHTPDYDCTNYYVTVDYILWIAQPGQVGTTYNCGVDGFYPMIPVSTQLLYPAYKPRSGFKIGAGTFLDTESLQLYGEYTLFYNNQDKGKYDDRPHADWNYAFSSTKNFYSNIFQRVDGILIREMCLGKHLTATPAAGLLFAIDEQWIGGILQEFRRDFPTVQDDTKINNYQKWWGIGPYIKVDSEAYLFCDDCPSNFAFTYGAGAALPWSRYQWHIFVRQPLYTALQNSGSNVKNTLWAMSPMVEMSLGMKWETVWGSEHQRYFSLKAAWENQIWLSHTYISTEQQLLSRAKNYIMQGLTVSAKLDF